MAFEYKIVTINDFKDDAATKASLDAEGASNWELIEIHFRNEQDSTTTATCIFKK